MEAEAQMGGDPSGRKLWRLLLLFGAAVIVVAFLIWWLWLPSQLGDPAKESLVVTNRTDVPLQIVQVAPDGTTSEITDVGSSSSVETYLSCAAAPLQALDPEGRVVASRPGSDECNLQRWIIR
jgi:hypothetical protein